MVLVVVIAVVIMAHTRPRGRCQSNCPVEPGPDLVQLALLLGRELNGVAIILGIVIAVVAVTSSSVVIVVVNVLMRCGGLGWGEVHGVPLPGPGLAGSVHLARVGADRLVVAFTIMIWSGPFDSTIIGTGPHPGGLFGVVVQTTMAFQNGLAFLRV